MEFTLYYRGLLTGNADASEKHRLRRHFHDQLKELWNQPPLDDEHDLLELSPEPGKTSIIKTVGSFHFAPLVTSPLKLVAEIDITMLRPQPPGEIVSRGGDIDNRLKTLLDSLTAPAELTALPSGATPQSGEEPFFCLLEDDKLITKVSVSTDRLLDSPSDTPEVVLLIRARTRGTYATWDNLSMF